MASVTGGKSSLTAAATNIGDGSKAPGPFKVRPANVRLNGRLLQFRRAAMVLVASIVKPVSGPCRGD